MIWSGVPQVSGVVGIAGTRVITGREHKSKNMRTTQTVYGTDIREKGIERAPA